MRDARAAALPREEECVVVGSGPGGSLVASELARAGRSVTVLEEGDFLSLDSTRAFSISEMERKYRNGGLTLAFGPARVQYVEGRCVGGGSEINSGLYHRTPPGVLDAWREHFRVQGLGEADLAPHFESNERALSVSYLPGEAPAAARLLRSGATALGWESKEVPRWFRYDAALPGGGRRQSMTETFVPAFLRDGGKLFDRARVGAVARRNKRWVVHGRRFGRGGEPFEIAARSLFLSAGAVQTPALLRRSGIARNVGSNLRMHPTVKIVAEFPFDVTDEASGVPSEQVKQFSPEISFGCSISSREHMAVNLYGFPDALAGLGGNWKRFATYYAMAQGTGRGNVRPVLPFADPLVTYALAREDAGRLTRGLALLAELLFAAGAIRLYPVVSGAPILESKDQLAAVNTWFRPEIANLMTIHLFSSCPMGERADRCAVDSYGRVHGTRGLYVNDASMLPTSTTVNPQGSIMAIARRNVLEFLR